MTDKGSVAIRGAVKRHGATTVLYVGIVQAGQTLGADLPSWM